MNKLKSFCPLNLVFITVALLFSMGVEANYSILYSQKAPAVLATALTYHNKFFWTSVTRSNTSTDILRFDPYTYQIENFISLPVRWIKGLQFINDDKLLVLTFESSSSNLYHLVEIDTRTKQINNDRILPRDWGAVTSISIEDANHYWVSTVNPARILKVDANSLKVLASINILEGSPHAIAFTSEGIWLSINNMGKPSLIQNRDPRSGSLRNQFEFHEAAGSISGLVMKENLWILSSGISRLIEVNPNVSLDKSLKNETTWKKSWNPIVDRFHDSHFNSFGLKEAEPTFSKYLIQKTHLFLNKSRDLPSQLDWRNKDGFNWMTSVKDQGQCGSCVAFASVALIEAQYKITNNLTDLDLDLSEQSAFSCTKGKCNAGIGFTEILDMAVNLGIPDELCMPYLSGNLGLDQTCKSCQREKDRSISIDRYEQISDYGFGNVEDVKEALLKGPLLTKMHVFDDFFYYKSGVYKHVAGSGTYQGRHTVTMVGFDDATHSFIVKNSWGPHWGEQGYFRIDYDDVSSIGAVTYQVHVGRSAIPFSLKLPEGNVITQRNEQLPLSIVGAELNTDYALQLRSSSSDQLLFEAPIKNEANLDVMNLTDGIYDIFITDPQSRQVRTNSFIVQKKAPETKLTLSILSRSENKTSFLLECSSNESFPKVVIELDNGNEKRTEEKTWPCPQTKFNIYHSNMKHPFQANARISIGSFDISSNQIEVE